MSSSDCEDRIHLQKLNFIYSALNNGWSIKKNKDTFIFSKKHENRREVFNDDYLTKFVLDNSTLAHK
jgi:hypothetical protein|uniref:Uncharacterized protein n=1 Tax=viral metagenome TaxID=1070528 RepID=A0A6C0JA95_9ZZZZ